MVLRIKFKFDFDTILYKESLSNYVKIHTKDEVIVTRKTIIATLEKLPTARFIKMHRSYVVAISKIDSFTNEHININKAVIPISRSFRESVLHALNTIS